MCIPIRLAGIIRESIVDGPGYRFVIFTQGCPHHCEGCQNPHTLDSQGGYESTTNKLLAAIGKNPLLAGVTFSGGEPFCQPVPLAAIARAVHDRGLNVVTYTGYTIEALMPKAESHPEIHALLTQSDYLVDGPFLLAQRTLSLPFRGSRNQRIIDPGASLTKGIAVETTF